jgi:hypothetical protein
VRQQGRLGRQAEAAHGLGRQQGHLGHLLGGRVDIDVGVAEEQRAVVEDQGRQGVDPADILALGDDRQDIGHVLPPVAGPAHQGGVDMAGLQQHRGRHRPAVGHPALGGRGRHASAADQLLIARDQRREQLGVGGGIEDLDGAAEVQAQAHFRGLGDDRLAAADQHRLGQALVEHGLDGAQHALVLALGIGDADGGLGGLAGPLEHRPHQLARAIDEQLQLGLIGVEVGDRPGGDAAVHGRLGHGRRDLQDQARVEGLGDDVLGAEHRRDAAIGRGHDLGGLGAGQFGDRLDGRDLHGLVDLARRRRPARPGR